MDGQFFKIKRVEPEGITKQKRMDGAKKKRNKRSHETIFQKPQNVPCPPPDEYINEPVVEYAPSPELPPE